MASMGYLGRIYRNRLICKYQNCVLLAFHVHLAGDFTTSMSRIHLRGSSSRNRISNRFTGRL